MLTGPSRQFDAVQPFNALLFSQALDRAQNAGRPTLPTARIDTSFQNEQDRMQEEQEAGRAQLAMTPGVRQGQIPSWEDTPNADAASGVADSPYLKPQSFRRFGQDYTYSPAGAAVQQGAADATRETTGDKARYDAAVHAGVDPKQAARMVYGRTGVADPDEKQPMYDALSAYIANPSRETASAAVAKGASLNQFPDRFAGEDAIDTGKHNTVVKGPNGEIGEIDKDTGVVTWAKDSAGAPAMGAAPGSSRGSSGLTELDRQINDQQQVTAEAERMIPRRRPLIAQENLGGAYPAKNPVYDPAAASRFVSDSTAKAADYNGDMAALNSMRSKRGDSSFAPPAGTAQPDANATAAAAAIAKIRGSNLPDAEKAARIAEVNKTLRTLRGGSQ